MRLQYMRVISQVIVGGAFLAALAGGLPAQAATVSVQIVEPFAQNPLSWAFTPATLTVHVGDTVVWTDTGQVNHTVTADGGAFDSGNVVPGARFSHTFTAPGTFAYHCAYHGWMKGTVVVVAAGQSAPPSTPSPAAEPAAPPPPAPSPSASLPTPPAPQQPTPTSPGSASGSVPSAGSGSISASGQPSEPQAEPPAGQPATSAPSPPSSSLSQVTPAQPGGSATHGHTGGWVAAGVLVVVAIAAGLILRRRRR